MNFRLGLVFLLGVGLAFFREKLPLNPTDAATPSPVQIQSASQEKTAQTHAKRKHKSWKLPAGSQVIESRELKPGIQNQLVLLPKNFGFPHRRIEVQTDARGNILKGWVADQILVDSQNTPGFQDSIEALQLTPVLNSNGEITAIQIPENEIRLGTVNDWMARIEKIDGFAVAAKNLIIRAP